MEMGQYHACGRGMDITKCHLCLLQPGQRTINTQWHFIVFLSCHRRILLLKVFARSLMLRINSAGRRRIWPRLCVQLPSLINFFFFGSLRKCASSVLIGKFFPRVQHGVNQSDTNCKKNLKKVHRARLKTLDMSLNAMTVPKKTERRQEMLVKEQFILMSSAPITKSASGHEGDCLSKLVLKLKQALAR